MFQRYHVYFYIFTFEMLDWKASDDFKWYVPITARTNHFRCRNIRITFSMATKHCYIKSLIYNGCIYALKSNKFEKIQSLFRADCSNQLTIWCLWYFTNIVSFYYKNIYTAHSFFHTALRQRNKAVQQAVSVIATGKNDQALIIIKILKSAVRHV